MNQFGPIPVVSLTGMKYTLVVVDDFFRFTWVIFLKSKDQTADQLIKLFKRLFNDKSFKTDRIMTDRGTEFINKTVKIFI